MSTAPERCRSRGTPPADPAYQRLGAATLLLVLLWILYLTWNPFVLERDWLGTVEALKEGSAELTTSRLLGRAALMVLVGILLRVLAIAPWLRVTALIGFCVFLELSQVPLQGRHPRLGDLIWGVSFGLLGLVATTGFRRHGRTVDWQAWVVAGCRLGSAASGALLLWCIVVDSAQHSLVDWDADFSLVLGDEADGGRPWQGCVAYLAIYSGPVPTPNAAPQVEFGSIDAGQCLPAGQPMLDVETRRQLAEAIARQGAFTIQTLIRSFAIAQEGPARIVTWSRNAYNRNFTLGQHGDRLVLRVRTPRNGKNGSENVPAWDGVVSTTRLLNVVVSHGPDGSRLAVNGSDWRGPDRVLAVSVDPIRNLAGSVPWLFLLVILPAGLYFELGWNPAHRRSRRLAAGVAVCSLTILTEMAGSRAYGAAVDPWVPLSCLVAFPLGGWIAQRRNLSAIS